MTIASIRKISPTILHVQLTGNVSPKHPAELSEAIIDELSKDNFEQVIIDTNSVSYINSAGIGSLLNIKTYCNESNISLILNYEQIVEEALKTVGLLKFFV